MFFILIILTALLLQCLVLLPALASFVSGRRLAYHAALYWAPIALAVVAGLTGSEGWLVAAVVQTLLSVSYNLHISLADCGKWWLG